MDFEKVKIEITLSGDNLGCRMTEGEKNIEWQKLTSQEQRKILSVFSCMYDFYVRFLKED